MATKEKGFYKATFGTVRLRCVSDWSMKYTHSSFTPIGRHFILHRDNLGQLIHTQVCEDFSFLSFLPHKTSNRKDLY